MKKSKSDLKAKQKKQQALVTNLDFEAMVVEKTTESEKGLLSCRIGNAQVPALSKKHETEQILDQNKIKMFSFSQKLERGYKT